MGLKEIIKEKHVENERGNLDSQDGFDIFKVHLILDQEFVILPLFSFILHSCLTHIFALSTLYFLWNFKSHKSRGHGSFIHLYISPYKTLHNSRTEAELISFSLHPFIPQMRVYHVPAPIFNLVQMYLWARPR